MNQHMRAAFSKSLLACAAALLFPCALRADSGSRAPETDGEKRLTKKFDTSLARFSSNSKATSKSFDTGAFNAKSFQSQKSFGSKNFYTPEFLTTAKANTDKSFTSKSANIGSETNFARAFAQGSDTFTPPKVLPVLKDNAASMVKPFESASRTYAGPEAVRKEQKFTPENGPRGGVIQGKVLTIDEVRNILNTSK